MPSDDRRTTIDHDTVREWVESRGGEPAAVAADAPNEAGMLRIRFPDRDGDEGDSGPVADADVPIEPLDWPIFFERFEDQELALVYREEADEHDDGGTDDRDASDPSRWYEFEDRVFVGEF